MVNEKDQAAEGAITCNQEFVAKNGLARLLDAGGDQITVTDKQLYAANFKNGGDSADEDEASMVRQVNTMLEHTAEQLKPRNGDAAAAGPTITDEARLRISPAPLLLSLHDSSVAAAALSRDGFVTNKRYQTLRDNMHSQSQLTSCYDEVYHAIDIDDDEDEDEEEDYEQDEEELPEEEEEEAVSSSSTTSNKKKLDDLIKSYEKSKSQVNSKLLNASDLIDSPSSNHRPKTVNKYEEEENLLKAFAGELTDSRQSPLAPAAEKVSNNLSAYMSEEARTIIRGLRTDSGETKPKVDDPADLLDGLLHGMKDKLAKKSVPPPPSKPPSSIQYNNYFNNEDEEEDVETTTTTTTAAHQFMPASTTSNISKLSMQKFNDMLASSSAVQQDETVNDEKKSYPFTSKSKSPPKPKKPSADKKQSQNPAEGYKIQSSINELSDDLVEKSAGVKLKPLTSSYSSGGGGGGGIFHPRYQNLIYDASLSSASPSVAPSRYATLDTRCDYTVPSLSFEAAATATAAGAAQPAKSSKKSGKSGQSNAAASASSSSQATNQERQKYSQHYNDDLNQLLSFIESNGQASQAAEEAKKPKKKPKSKKKSEPAAADQPPVPPASKTTATPKAGKEEEKYSQSSSSSSVSSDKAAKVTTTAAAAAANEFPTLSEIESALASEVVNEDEFVTVTSKWTKSRKQPKQPVSKTAPAPEPTKSRPLVKQASVKTASPAAQPSNKAKPDVPVATLAVSKSGSSLKAKPNESQAKPAPKVEETAKKAPEPVAYSAVAAPKKPAADPPVTTAAARQEPRGQEPSLPKKIEQPNPAAKLEECKSASSPVLKAPAEPKKKYESLIKRNSNSVVFLDECAKKSSKPAAAAKDQALSGISFGFLSSGSDNEREGGAQTAGQRAPSRAAEYERPISVEFIGASLTQDATTTTNNNTASSSTNSSRRATKLKASPSSESNGSDLSSTPSRSASSSSSDSKLANQYHPTRTNTKHRLKRSQRTSKASSRYKFTTATAAEENKDGGDCSTADETINSNIYSHKSYSIVSEEKSHHEQEAAYMETYDETESSQAYYGQQQHHPVVQGVHPQHVPLAYHHHPPAAHMDGAGAQPFLMPGYHAAAYVAGQYHAAGGHPMMPMVMNASAYAYSNHNHHHAQQQQPYQQQQQQQTAYQYAYAPNGVPYHPGYQPFSYYVQPQAVPVPPGQTASATATAAAPQPYYMYRPVAHFQAASHHHQNYYQQYYNYPMYQNYVPVTNLPPAAAASTATPTDTAVSNEPDAAVAEPTVGGEPQPTFD